MDFETQSALVSKYFKTFDGKEVSLVEYKLIDLYRTIHCYRMYKSLDQFFSINPELLSAESEIRELWHEFSKLSNEDLAELSLEILKDINKI